VTVIFSFFRKPGRDCIFSFFSGNRGLTVFFSVFFRKPGRDCIFRFFHRRRLKSGESGHLSTDDDLYTTLRPRGGTFLVRKILNRVKNFRPEEDKNVALRLVSWSRQGRPDFSWCNLPTRKNT
jgi:hypothetical protein